MNRGNVWRVLAAGLLLLAWAGDGAAREQSIIRVRIATPDTGPTGTVPVTLEATNTSTRDIFASVSVDGEPPKVVCNAFALAAGETKSCTFALFVADQPVVVAKLKVTAEAEAGGVKLESHPYDIYFKTAGGTFTRTTYQDLYLDGNCGGKPLCSAETTVAPEAVVQPPPSAPFPMPAPKQVFPGVPAGPDQNRLYTVSGQFSYLDLQRRRQPAWNWAVKLRWILPNGKRVSLGADTVSSDGTWIIKFRAPDGYTGQNLDISYAPENSFITFLADVRTQTGWKQERYAFHDRVATHIPRIYRAPATSTDLSNVGQYAGLGDAFRNTMNLWNALKSAGVIDGSFGHLTNVVFPNLHETCSGTTLWSCRIGDELWVRADDAGAPFTMLHELGHAIEAHFWTNFPADSGGEHGWYACGTKGMALSEGLASAIAAMIEVPLDGAGAALDQSGSLIPIEEPAYSDVSGCTANDLSGSELAVAATIWDLMDRHNDQRNAKEDNRNYRNGYLPIYLILKNGAKTSLADYKSVFKQQQPAGVQGWIDDVFTMNDMR